MAGPCRLCGRLPPARRPGPGLILVGLLAFEADLLRHPPWLLVLAGGAARDAGGDVPGRDTGRAGPAAGHIRPAGAGPGPCGAARATAGPARRPAGGRRAWRLRQFVKTGRLLLVLMLVLTVPTSGIDPDEVSPHPAGPAVAGDPAAGDRRHPDPDRRRRAVLSRLPAAATGGALSANPLIWMVLPSAAFGLGHAWNAVTLIDALYYVGWTFLFGCIAARHHRAGGVAGPGPGAATWSTTSSSWCSSASTARRCRAFAWCCSTGMAGRSPTWRGQPAVNAPSMRC